MFLTDVLTLAVGTLITLVLVHLAVFWVTRPATHPQPHVVYMQPPPAPPQQQVTFAHPPETQQSVHVPAMEPQVQMPPATFDLPKRHGE
jgi:hypothetical protein